MCSLPITARTAELLEGVPGSTAFVPDPTDDLQTNILLPHGRHVLNE